MASRCTGHALADADGCGAASAAHYARVGGHLHGRFCVDRVDYDRVGHGGRHRGDGPIGIRMLWRCGQLRAKEWRP